MLTEKQIFINLPVNDVDQSLKFYLALGFTLNPLFTDEEQKCVIWSNAIYLMIQSKAFSNSYLNKSNIEQRHNLLISHTLPVESIHMVDEMLEQGLKAGGKEPVPVLKESFMYLRSIEDLDGYIWGIMYLNVDEFKKFKN